MPFLNFKFKISNLKFSSGLTLIELLVVVAILGILASITSVAMIGQQKKARDAQRKNDLVQIKKALSSAKNDCRAAAYYPKPGVSGVEKNDFTSLTAYLVSAGRNYINSTIKDPKDPTYFYRIAQGTTVAAVCAGSVPGAEIFIIRALLENTKDPDLTNSYDQCSSKVSSVTYTAPDPTPVSGDGYYYVCSD